MKDLGLEVEALEEPLHVSSPVGTRVRVNQICQDCELEISGTLLTMDLKIMNMSEFYVILGMDWLTTHQVIIDCDRRRVTIHALDGNYVTFQGDKHDTLPRAVYDSRWHKKLVGWLASLTLEDKAIQDLGLPWVVCEYKDVFSDELPGLLPYRDVDSCHGRVIWNQQNLFPMFLLLS